MPAKKEKPQRPSIAVQNRYFETANPGNATFQLVIKKQVFRDAVSRYWLSRALARVDQLSKAYHDTRAEIARSYAHKYDKDGEQKDKDENVVRSWKKGDPITFPDGSVSIDDTDGFRKAINALQDEEIDLGVPQVPFNEVLDLPLNEEMIILPLMEDIDEDQLQELYKKQQEREQEEREREDERLEREAERRDKK